MEPPEWLSEIPWEHALRGGLILFGGLILVRVLAAGVRRALSHRLSPQGLMLVRKGIVYTGTALVLVMTLREFGFKLTALLGAAGVAGVAIGFAAQTSLSNVISGFFLIWEKPFEVGDVLKIGDTTGTVESIDLLAATLRTFDNQAVRIPNETLVKTQFTNITRYPIRRFDINLGVAYKEDVDRVLTVLREVVDANPNALIEPEPVVAFTGFGESQLNFFLGAWFHKPDFLKLRNSLLRDIKNRFNEEGIEIPFPHRVVIHQDGPAPAAGPLKQ